MTARPVQRPRRFGTLRRLVRRSRALHVIVPLGITLVVVLIGRTLEQLYRTAERDRERFAVAELLNPRASALTARVNHALELLDAVGAVVQAIGYPPPSEPGAVFDAFARSLARADQMIAVQFVEGTRIVYTMPLAGNEAALGLDLATHTEPASRASIAGPTLPDRVRVAGPQPLVQGGLGLIVQRPLLRPDGTLWGRPSLVFDVERMLADAGLSDLPRLRVAVRLAGGASFSGDSTVLEDDPVVVPVRAPALAWDIAAVPLRGWLGASALELGVFRGAYLLIGVLLGWLAFVLLSRQRMLEEAVEQRSGALASAAERLRQEEERLDVALRTSGLGLWQWQPETEELEVTRELRSILGVGPDAVVTRTSYFAQVHPEDRERLRQLAKQLVATGAPVAAEYRLLRPDGTERHVIANATAQKNPGGGPVQIIGAVHDNTERHELEERLRQSQKMESIGTLAGGIAHDFNNLLTAILGHGQFALQSVAHDSDVRIEVEAMLIAADRARLLTSQLLAFSRRQILEATLLELNAVVRDVARLLHRIIGEDIRLELELTSQPLDVRADAGQLTQVLLNLATNARDAMPRGGRFRITTEADHVDGARARLIDIEPGDYARLRVHDTGMGMDAATAARIFDPYFTTKPVGKGTGLGLSTVYGIVRQSNGHVWVETEPGHGTTFHVLLPVVAAEA